MASKPEKIGNKWRTRWRFKSGWHWIWEEYEADCKAAQRYVSSLSNKISMHDPLILGKAYLHGDEAAKEKVSAARTFGTVAQAYVKTKVAWGRSRARTFDSVLRNHYQDWLDWPIDEITDDHFNAKYKTKMESGWFTKKGEFRPYKRNGVIAMMEIGLQVLTYAHDHGLLSGPNPAKSRYIAFTRVMKRPGKRKPFTLAEFYAILGLVHPDDDRIKTTLRDYAMVVTMGVGGLRIGELCGLNVGDVDLENRMLVIRARYLVGEGRVEGTKETDEDDDPRLIAFNEDYAAFITPIVAGRPADAPLFPGILKGRHLRPDEWRGNVWTPLLQMAVELGLVRGDIEIVPHVVRHSTTTWFSGHLDLHHVQDRLGHKTERATNHYRHRNLDPERAAMDAVFPDGF